MSIRVTCQKCGQKLKVSDGSAGKRIRCPKCEFVIAIPAAENEDEGYSLAPEPAPDPKEIERVEERRRTLRGETPEAKPPADVLRDVLNSFAGKFVRAPTPTGYRMVAAMVAGFVLLLPLVYLGIIALIGWATLYHATRHVEMTRFGIGTMFYLAPIVAGALCLVCLLKPLFARRASRFQSFVLGRDEQPMLWSFVERIAIAIDAPVPTRIVVDGDVNAAARVSGLFGAITRHLELRIGMPLVDGLTVEQFGGIIAHELGHFSQSGATAVKVSILRVHEWIGQVAFEPDDWDRRFMEAAETQSRSVMLVVLMASMMVGITRGILKGILFLSALLVAMFDRMIEFDADTYQAGLVGADAFEATFRRMYMLSATENVAWKMVAVGAERDVWPESYPRLLTTLCRLHEKDLNSAVNAFIASARHGVFDTHPSAKDRIRAVQSSKAFGLFHCELPAQQLFVDYSKLCKQVTFDVFYSLVGKRIRPDRMQPVEDFVIAIEAPPPNPRAGSARFRG